MFAHISKDFRVHSLEQHHDSVANRAKNFLSFSGNKNLFLADIAYFIGSKHDIGKASEDFQRYLKQANGIPTLPTTVGIVDHSTAGGILALGQHGFNTQDIEKIISAMVSFSHHTGLKNLIDVFNNRQQKINLFSNIQQIAPELCKCSLNLAPIQYNPNKQIEYDLMTRIIYSAVCDADFLDTEEFFDLDKNNKRSNYDSLKVIKDRFESSIVDKFSNAPHTELNKLRTDIRNICKIKASQQNNVFSLSAATGSAKTIAAMSFALNHAIFNKMDRVICIIPYTSIIEQNAQVYSSLIGKENVLEHHSAVNNDANNSTITQKHLLATENWDAPIIVSTTVQFFEALFKNKSSRCRKLHNILNSVIIFDEAQLLPPEYIDPITKVLEILVRDYNCSIVFSTATQPALLKGQRNWGFQNIIEIVPNDLGFSPILNRASINFDPINKICKKSDIVDDIIKYQKILAVVTLKRNAKSIVDLMDSKLGNTNTIHLSSSMCPEHRTEIINDIKIKMLEDKDVRVVSTSLIEAGVCLDFPVVFSEFCGIDSILQRAGRCNREGLLSTLGFVKVFNPEPTDFGIKWTPSLLKTAAGTTTSVFNQCGWALKMDDTKLITKYFNDFFSNINNDKHQINYLKQQWNFEDVANNFNIIDSSWTDMLVVPFGNNYKKYLQQLSVFGQSRGLIRKLQRLSINVSRKKLISWKIKGWVNEISDGVYILCNKQEKAYTHRFGLEESLIGTF